MLINPYFKLIKNNFDILNMLVARWMRRVVLLYDSMASWAAASCSISIFTVHVIYSIIIEMVRLSKENSINTQRNRLHYTSQARSFCQILKKRHILLYLYGQKKSIKG